MSNLRKFLLVVTVLVPTGTVPSLANDQDADPAASEPGLPTEARYTDGPLVTDRPDFTESAVTVAPGRVQFEVGYTFTREGETEAHNLGEVLLRIGVLPRAELRLGLNSFAWTESPGSDSHGFEDLAVGVKLMLQGGSDRFDLLHPKMAVLVGTTLPTGADAVGDEGLQPDARLALAWDLSARLALGTNVNLAYASQESSRFGQFSGSVSLALTVAQKLGAYVEYFGFVPGSQHGPNTSFLNGGLTVPVTEDFQLDGRIGVGLNGMDPEVFGGFGLAWRP